MYGLCIYMSYYFLTFIEQHIYPSSKESYRQITAKAKNNGESEKRDNINTWVSLVHLVFFLFFFCSKHLQKINVETYNHEVRISYHTWEKK